MGKSAGAWIWVGRLLGLVPPAGLVLLAAACTTAPQRNVLIVVLDTTRADHLSSYGHTRATTPNLDRLAAEGTRYDNAWSQAPWTLPSMATILTGLPPHRHGAGQTRTGIAGIGDDVRTLAQRMTDAGYRTTAFINVVWCGPRISSLDRGFDNYDFYSTDASNRAPRTAGATTDAALAWLKQPSSAPFFMVVHYFDPHLTYDPPAPYDTMFETGDPRQRVQRGFGSAADVLKLRDGRIWLSGPLRHSLVARYDGELRYTDEEFGRLRVGLEELGLWEGTLIVVVADHGEEFWDHGGFEHGHSHYREVLRAPLIVHRPGGAAGEVRAERVRLLDIAPTVLEYAGLPFDDLPGQPLNRPGSREAVAEGSLWAGDLASIRSDLGTLILDRTSGEQQFFEADDVAERKPLSELPDAARPLLRQLKALPLTQDNPSPTLDLTDEELEQLRSLGYIK